MNFILNGSTIIIYMPNTCPILISRGKNKGKACYEVNKKCRHKNSQCPHCGIKFTVETSYTRHIAICPKRQRQPPVKSRPRPKVKMTASQPVAVPSEPSEASEAPEPSNNTLLEKIEKLERELQEVKSTPAVHHHWNIVLGMNFFDELVTKMGKDHAINFLAGIAQDGKPVDVINKLYLEGNSPNSYPIACRDHDHFRYVDSDHRVIDDKGGHSISKIVTAGVQDALILAANEAIHEQVKGMSSDQIDVGILQKYVADMRRSLPKDRIISELAHITNIPNHPFFTDR